MPSFQRVVHWFGCSLLGLLLLVVSAFGLLMSLMGSEAATTGGRAAALMKILTSQEVRAKLGLPVVCPERWPDVVLIGVDRLTSGWCSGCSTTGPLSSLAAERVAHRLRATFPARRNLVSHSLPDSKRYPDDPDEYATVLGRQNRILDELVGGGAGIVLLTTEYSGPPGTVEISPCARTAVDRQG